MQVSNFLRALSRTAVLCALVQVLIATAQPCCAWQDSGEDEYADEYGDSVTVCGNPHDQCGGRPGFLQRIIGRIPFSGCGGCGLGGCHLPLHQADAEDEESGDEDPDERDFPRFHPIPIRPVFAPRDQQGMPIPPAPDSSLIESPEYDPGVTPQREELAPPEPLGEQARVGSIRPKPRTHQASWVFQHATKPHLQKPSRNPRPQFDTQEHPRKSGKSKR